ncbi:MAG: addiction module protein [Pyrinomonadaceae bacterium]
MNTSNVATLNERLLGFPEPLRENLARYITEHLDDIQDDMQWSEDPMYLSDDLKEELSRREAAYEENPHEGISWQELENRLLNSR